MRAGDGSSHEAKGALGVALGRRFGTAAQGRGVRGAAVRWCLTEVGHGSEMEARGCGRKKEKKLLLLDKTLRATTSFYFCCHR